MTQLKKLRQGCIRKMSSCPSGPVAIAPRYRPSRYSAGISCRRSTYIHTVYTASFGFSYSAALGKPNSVLVCQQALPVQLAAVDLSHIGSPDC